MPTDRAAQNSAKFGMFKGVFTPSILTILGVIMYLRYGWVIGHAGLLGTIVIVLLAHVVSFTTGMSISSIATNKTVGAGGDYYMISRSLGLPIGGAIGLTLFVALALSTSLYLLGFAESFLSAFGFANDLMGRRIVGSAACLLLTSLTFFSTSLALRMQFLVLAAIGLSFVSLFMGDPAPPNGAGLHLWFVKDGPVSLEMAFAVFFPAVTGFTAGVAMSGDLKDPRRALPRGTMLAISVGLVVYLAIPIYFAFHVDFETLRTDQMVWLRMSRFPVLIYSAIFAATVSSALGSVLGAPRYLQALALDGVVPHLLGKGHGPLNEPRIGTVATFFIAEAGIIAGELDLIARIVTMFFLTSYGFLCLAAGLQAWSGIPSYRPQFKTPVWVSLLGAATCMGLMFKLDTVAMVGATTIMFAIFAALKRRQFRSSPGDTWGGFWAAVVQAGILQLHHRTVDSKNWRPNMIVFGGPPVRRRHLILMARWLIQSRGLATYFHIVKGNVQEDASRARATEPAVARSIEENYPQMLSRVSVANDVYGGIVTAAQSYGIAGMMPNTVLMGWGDESERPVEFTNLVRDLIAIDHNLLLLEHDEHRNFGARETIDIWWGGLGRNGELILLLTYMLKSSEEWAKARVRINTVVDDERREKIAKEKLTRIVRDARLTATINVIRRDPLREKVPAVIARTSERSDLVIMGLRPPRTDESEEYISHVSSFIVGLGTTLMVRASMRFDGGEILFDDPENGANGSQGPSADQGV